jgi:hypothetical protein
MARGGYCPQVVFEILSPCNTRAEMRRKLEFYDCYGVEEYYQYDPDQSKLLGWHRARDGLKPIESMIGWVSPRLGIRFEWDGGELSLQYPNGDRFLSSIELAASRDHAQERAALLAAKLRELGVDPDAL